MEILIVILVVDAVVFGVAGAVVGSKKESGAEGFFLGFFLGPIGLLISLFLKGNREPCPQCREYVDPSATKCPKCGSGIARADPASSATNGKHIVDNETKKCTACAEMIKLEAIKCRYCGTDFDRNAVAQEVAERMAQLTEEAKVERGEKCPYCGTSEVYYDYLGDLFCPKCEKSVSPSI